MSVDLSNYDIYVYRGNTYKLDFSYTDNNNIGIDLSNYEAKLQVRRSAYGPYLLAELTENFPTGSFGRGLSGDFVPGSGVTGNTGGIILNYSGVTGDVHIEIDSETTYAMKTGKHSYDFQIKDLSTGTKTTILRGRLDVSPVSRIIERLEPGFGGNEGISGESG